jgi:hypothetical protein
VSTGATTRTSRDGLSSPPSADQISDIERSPGGGSPDREQRRSARSRPGPRPARRRDGRRTARASAGTWTAAVLVLRPLRPGGEQVRQHEPPRRTCRPVMRPSSPYTGVRIVSRRLRSSQVVEVHVDHGLAAPARPVGGGGVEDHLDLGAGQRFVTQQRAQRDVDLRDHGDTSPHPGSGGHPPSATVRGRSVARRGSPPVQA